MATRKEYEMLFKLGAQLGQDFNGSFSQAQKILSQTQKEIAALQKVQSDITAYSKQNQSIADTQNKLEMYEKQLKAVKAELEASGGSSAALASKEADLEYKVKSTAASLQQKKDKLNELGQALEDAGVDTSKLADESKKLKDKVNELKDAENVAGEEAKVMGDKSESAFSQMGEALIAAGVAKGLKEIVDYYAECADGATAYADEIGTMSVQYGIAAKDLQAYTYAAELLDVDVNTITSSLARNTRAMYNAADGSAQYVEAYDKIGISVTDANGNLRDAQTVYWEAIDALSAMTNETERDGIAMTLLGRNAMELNTLIKAGSGVMNEYTAMAEEAGYIMSEEVLETLCALDDQEQIQQKNLQGLKNTIGAAVAPELIKLKQIQNEMLVSVTEFAAENPGIVKGVVLIAGALSTLLSVYTAYKGAKVAIIALRKLNKLLIKEETAAKVASTTATQGATAAQHGFNAAMNANPIGVFAVSLTSLIGLFSVLKNETKSASYELLTLSRDYAKEVKNLQEESRQLSDSYEESVLNSEASADAALAYLDRLMELEKQGIKTVEQQKEYNQLLERIKSIMPDINLQIDEQTGLYKGGATALEDQIKAQKELIKLEAIKDYAAGLEKQAVETQAQTQKIREELEAANKLYQEIGGDEARKKENKNMASSYSGLYAALTADANDAYLAVLSLEKSLEESEKTYQGIQSELDWLWDEYYEGETATLGLEERTNSLNDTIEGAAKTSAENILTLVEAYEEARSAAESSITSQYNLWDTAATVIPKDISDINTALETQTAYWSNYTTDLTDLRDNASHIEGLEEIIATFADGSEDSVNTIASLANATDEELNNFVKNYQVLKQYQADAANAIAETKSPLETAIEELNLSEEAENAGHATIEAYIQAIREGTPDAEAAASELAEIIKESFPSVTVPGVGTFTVPKYSAVALPGYATGTDFAARGWALTGENGPELIYFNGGETVYDANETTDILRPTGGDHREIQLTVAPVFHVTTTDSIDDALERCNEQIVQNVLEALNEAALDSRRGAYA